jgi:hypothetical protein
MTYADNGMSLDVFVGKQVDMPMVVVRERQGSEGTIRLKCPKRIINMLGIPEKGYLTVHIKGYHRERIRYGVTGSSLRINLGAGFNDLWLLLSCLKTVYWSYSIRRTGNLFTVYVRNRLNTLRDMVIALYVNTSTLLRRINTDVPTTVYLLRTSSRKRSKNG